MKELVEEMIMQRRLRWLCHVSRMHQNRMPKQVLFSRLKKTRPFHGVKMRWKDRVTRDLRTLKLQDLRWYSPARDRNKWHTLCCPRLKVAKGRRTPENRGEKET